MTKRTLRFAIATHTLVAAWTATIVAPAHAAVLVYEGFDVAGGVDASNLDGKAGATSVGFDPGSSWTVLSYVDPVDVPPSAIYETSGLTFGNLLTTGGLARLQTGERTVSGYSAVNPVRPLDVAATGTIYGSYLFQPVVDFPHGSTISEIVIGSATAIGNNDSGPAFDVGVNAKSYGTPLGGGRINGAYPAGELANTGTILSAGTTYLLLFEMQGLVSSGSATQTLTTWILTEDQFDSLKAGGLTSAELNSAEVQQVGTNSGTYSAGLQNDRHLHLYNFLVSEGNMDGRFDEVRVSNASLDEVTPISSISQPGDFDGDGDVDGADFVAWQTHFPTPSGATPADGDADGDGDVDGADFVVWQTNFPFTPSPGITSIPEPHSIVLAIVGGLIVVGRLRKR